MSSRLEFVMLADAPDVNMRALCQSSGVNRKTGCKWPDLYRPDGEAGLEDRSRQPHSSPNRSDDQLEAAVLALHEKYPCRGARKLKALWSEEVGKPPPNLIAAILRRHGRQLVPHVDKTNPGRKRFEHDAPNSLWQVDFKGHFPLTDSKIRKLDAATIRKHKARTNDFIERSNANCLSETASIRSKHGNVPSMPDAISTT